MNEKLTTECFLCWRVIKENNFENENLENKTDKDKSCYKFNENQIVNCKEYLQNAILSECEKQDKFSSSWDSQLFCFNCFEMSEGLTAVHEVFLEVQQQLTDIVKLFNQEILKERLAKQRLTVDCNSKNSCEKNYISSAVENENLSESNTTCLQEHLNSKNVQEQQTNKHFPSKCPNPQNEMKKTAVLNSVDMHTRKVIPTTLDENSLFLITSDTVDNLCHDFDIKEESVSSDVYPLFSDCTNKNVSHSNNSDIGTESIEAVDRKCINNSTVPGRKELVIKLTRLQFGPDGKVLIPSESTPITGGRTKRKAAIRAVEVIKANKDMIETTQDNQNSSDDDNDIQSEITDFESSCESECNDDESEESTETMKIKNKPSTQYSLKKKKSKKRSSSSHSCEKCGKKFQFKRSVLLHQMRFKQCDVVKKRKNYFCKICNRTIHGGTKNLHIWSHTRPFSCHECGVNFNRPDALRRHMKKKHITEFNFPCDRCDKKFKVVEDLKDHTRQHTKEDFMSNCDRGDHYQCNICEEKFQKTNNLNLDLFLTHMFYHGIYKCAHCNEKFDTKDSLKEHWSSSEKHIGGFTCDLCSRVSPSFRAWKMHKKGHLNKNKNPACEHCGVSYTTTTQLRYHIMEKHTEKAEKNFKCNQEGCDKAYITNRQLTVHVLHAHKQRICEVCGLKVKNISLHMDIHNQIRYECDICGKKFKQKSNLSAHKKFIHEGHEVVCKICGHKSSSKGALKLHILKHYDERPFKCSECDKCFYRPDNLTTHMRSHTGEKPYKCDNCGKQFSRKDNLNTHIKKCPSSNKTSHAS